MFNKCYYKSINYLSLFIVFLVILNCVSCHEKHSKFPEPEPSNYNNALPLKVGNYWIYSVHGLAIIGPGSIQPDTSFFLDSAYVKRDTLISGQKYFEIVSRVLPGNFFRDSAGYLLSKRYTWIVYDTTGGIPKFRATGTTNPEIIFSGTDFQDTISRFPNGSFRIIKNIDSLITTPAGTFKTANSMRVTTRSGPDPETITFEDQSFYANNVGIVKAQSNSGPFMYLIRYKVY